MKRYYYLDENGNKKQYVGKIINDYITGETYGLLTQQEVSHKEIICWKDYQRYSIWRNLWNTYFSRTC